MNRTLSRFQFTSTPSSASPDARAEACLLQALQGRPDRRRHRHSPGGRRGPRKLVGAALVQPFVMLAPASVFRQAAKPSCGPGLDSLRPHPHWRTCGRTLRAPGRPTRSLAWTCGRSMPSWRWCQPAWLFWSCLVPGRRCWRLTASSPCHSGARRQCASSVSSAGRRMPTIGMAMRSWPRCTRLVWLGLREAISVRRERWRRPLLAGSGPAFRRQRTKAHRPNRASCEMELIVVVTILLRQARQQKQPTR